MTDRPIIVQTKSDHVAAQPTGDGPYRRPPETSRRADRVPHSESEAVKVLDTVPFFLFAARQATKVFWALMCKRYPELR
jgi:hypothetical protein